MIIKDITNIQPEHMQWVLSNLARASMTTENITNTSVRATGEQSMWEIISLPSDVTITLVEE